LDAFDIAELAEKQELVRAVRLTADDARRLQQLGHRRTTIGALLWRLGVFGPRDRLVPIVEANAFFRLRRWPDFGRLEHTADHLRLAARLSRQFVTANEAAAAIGQPLEKVRPFLNACLLCELMILKPAALTAAPQPATPSKAAPESRYKGLFHSIRSALNFAIS
jgi:hypothetical protein